MMKRLHFLHCLAGGALCAAFPSGLAFAVDTPDGYVHENGIGPDPDGDTNPATITQVIKRDTRSAEDMAGPYRVIDFEVPPGRHGDIIREAYAKDYGVHFGKGVKRQICDGQRHFYYDSICTYPAAPSGSYAAGYYDYLNAPLVIEFDQPVCVATMAIYPTGGADNEPFTVTIKGWDETGAALPDANAEFEWSKKTVRWMNMAGAYYVGGRAKKIEVSMKSGNASEAGDILRFLIDDLAFVQDDCEEVLDGFIEQDAGSDDLLSSSDELLEGNETLIEGS